MKTGNTAAVGAALILQLTASMEPGHEDREYAAIVSSVNSTPTCLNGARS